MKIDAQAQSRIRLGSAILAGVLALLALSQNAASLGRAEATQALAMELGKR